MCPQYYCIKDCLRLVQELDITSLDKLEVEVLLLKVLGCVLEMDGELQVVVSACTEESARALLEDLQAICNSTSGPDLGRLVLERVKEFAAKVLPSEDGPLQK